MAYSFNGTNQSLNTTSTPVSTEPMTLAVWFTSNQNTSNKEIFNVNVSSNIIFALNASGAISGDPLQIYKGASGQFPVAQTTTGFNTTDTFHACGVFASTASRSAYINGGSKGTNTTSLATGSGTYRIDIGAVRGASAHNGMLSEAAIWSADLTDDEIISLSKGFKPYRIRPQSLVFYSPLIRDLNDIKGGLALTNNNSATVADHPRVY